MAVEAGVRLYGDLLRRAVAKNEAADFLIMPGGATGDAEVRSFGSVHADAIGLARSLRETLGVAEGEAVGIISPNCAEYTVTFFAGAYARTVTACIPHLLAPPEMVKVLTNIGCRVLIVHESQVERVNSIRPQLPCVERLVCIGRAKGYDEFAALAAATEGEGGAYDADASPDETLILFLTSGTTSTPKAVAHTHRSIIWFDWCSFADSIPSGTSTTILFNSMAWVGGQFITMMALYRLSRVVIMPGFERDAYVAHAVRYRANFGMLMPQLVWELARLPEDQLAVLGNSLRVVMYGGGICSPTVINAFLAAFPDTQLIQVWGMTEVNVGTFLTDAAHRRGGRLLESCGRPVRDVRIALRDTETGEIHQRSNETGEMVIQTPGLFSQYWNNALATQEAFAGQYFRTGDIAVRDEEGYFYIKDRVKDVIVTSVGYNVFAREVEDVLMEHPSIKDVAVASILDDRDMEMVWAFVVPEEGQRVSHGDIVRFCQGRLADYKCPSGSCCMSALPRNHNTKVLKRKLRVPTESVISLFQDRHPSGDWRTKSSERFGRCNTCGTLESPSLSGMCCGRGEKPAATRIPAKDRTPVPFGRK